MSNKALHIVFMGTPDFAVPALMAIAESRHKLAAVVTAPDKPAGRGRKLRASAVKKTAEARKITVLQPEKLKNPDFLHKLEAIQADVFVVVAFRMLPKEVWQMPPEGCFNLHASLLPQYRGAAPINHAVINGETKTGLTTFFLNETIDTGDIILQEEIVISPTETAGDLHDRMMLKGASLVIQSLDLIASDNYTLKKQSHISSKDLKAAPKIFQEDCHIDWSQDNRSVYNHIRGLSPYPAAWTIVKTPQEKWRLKIFKARQQTVAHTFPPGTIQTDNSSYLKIATGNGWIDVGNMQVSGKKPMPVTDFLRGHSIAANSRCE